MASTFFGIEIGKRGVLAHKMAQDVTTHNIVNASTPGYTRQVAHLGATIPFAQPAANRQVLTAAQVGTGVEVDYIKSVRDNMLDMSIKQNSWMQNFNASMQERLNTIQAIFNEPNSPTLGDTMNEFFGAWNTLANQPDSLAIRRNLLNVSERLAGEFRFISERINDVERDIDASITSGVKQVNKLAEQIKNLNIEIFKATHIGDNPNDLIDKRDNMLNELAKFTDFQLQHMEDGTVKVSIYGHILVSKDYNTNLVAVRDPGNNNFMDVRFDDGIDARITGGELGGLMSVRDTYIAGYRTELNAIAATIIDRVNTVHAAGYALNSATVSGMNFFTGTDITNIAVDPAFAANPSLIAAASNPNAPGDGTNALALSQIRYETNMAGNTITLGESYANMISGMGSDIYRLNADSMMYTSVAADLNARKASYSGVSLDEEMTNLIRFQHGYNASTKVIKVQDELIQSILGLVG